MASYDDTATVSGSIVRVNDGADSVPLKNWLVTLPASLSGYSEVNVKQAKKNLLKNEKYQATSNRVNIGQSDDDFSISLRAGTYTLSVTSSINVRAYYRGSLDGSNTLISPTYSTSYSGTFTLSEDKDVRMWVIGQDGSVSTSDIFTIQLEVGSTATSYEAYSAPTQYTASLGRTIYGGQADIVTGEGEAQFAYHKITADDEIYTYPSADGFRIPTASWTSGAMVNQANSGGLCNILPTVTASTSQGIRFGINNDQIYMVQCYDLFGSTVEDFKTYVTNHDVYVVYRLATPETFTFTPITAETELGTNNFWADEGNTELTYYKDGYGFTSVTIHKETLEGEPVVETAKLHRIVYGGLVDVVKGKAEPKNIGEFSERTYEQYQKCTWEYTNGGIVVTATGTYARVGFIIPVKTGKSYTVSYRGFSDGEYRRVYLNSSASWSGQFVNNLLTPTDTAYSHTFTASTDVLFIGLYVTAGTTTGAMTISDLMVEEGSPASSYVPHFEPFTFPPISMETDEGENTLYADEGDSAITYRKAVE